MSINTNTAANSATRALSGTSTQLARSIGRLSSGFRINRSADDPAGIAIANRLRAEARALGQASRNAAQAGAVLQIVDGAIGIVSSILDRMKELGAQAASDNVSDTDRVNIQAEFAELQAEITRLADTTKFQGNGLINGGFGAAVDTNPAISTALAAGTGIDEIKLSGTAPGTFTISELAGDMTLSFDPDGAGPLGVITQTVSGIVAGRQTINFDQFGIRLETTAAFNPGDADATDIVVTAGAASSFLVTSSGAYTTSDLVSLAAIDLRLTAIGLGAPTDVLSTAAEARLTLTNIDNAIDFVAGQIGTLGAAINRIEFAATNVATLLENVRNAEGVIRDVDIATESTEFARLQILQQSGVAMLAQANAAPQALLQLLSN